VPFLIVKSGCNPKDTEYALLEEENIKKGSPWKVYALTLGCVCTSNLTGNAYVNADEDKQK